MNIVLLYNQRHIYPDKNDYRNQLESDFDDPETTYWQIKHLNNLGFNVIPIEANERAYFKLYRLRKKIDLVLNLSEGIYGRDRESHLPAMLEMLQIRYTGCSPMVEGIILNKAKTKDILIAHNIPTLSYQLFYKNFFDLNQNLKFPLIVKPVAQGSSAGITQESIVYDKKSLIKQIKKLLDSFGEAVLVEPFLKGREFSISLIGNPPKILPIIESNHSVLPRDYFPIDSLEVKWYFEEEDNGSNYLICPAKIDRSLKKKLEIIALRTWKVLGIEDWCRIDIRCDEEENPYVLEVNSPPGIIPPEVSLTSYFPLSARAQGWDYEKLLSEIINSAFKKYNRRNTSFSTYR